MSEQDARSLLEPNAKDINPFHEALAASQAISLKRLADMLTSLDERTGFLVRALQKRRS